MAGEDPERVAWIRSQPCTMRSQDPCSGPVEAHHAGRDRGMSQRAHDDTCVPLCRKHHAAWHSASGVFRTYKKAERRAWADAKVAWFRARYAEAQTRDQAP